MTTSRFDYPALQPDEARHRGWRMIEIADERPDLARFNGAVEKLADTKGWRIIGRWDEKETTKRGELYVRTYWCAVN